MKISIAIKEIKVEIEGLESNSTTINLDKIFDRLTINNGDVPFMQEEQIAQKVQEVILQAFKNASDQTDDHIDSLNQKLKNAINDTSPVS